MKGKKQSAEHIAKRFASRRQTIAARITERIWSHVDKRGPEECWPWKSSVRKFGHGYMEIFGKKYLAHRLVFNLVNPGVIDIRGSRPEEGGNDFVLHNCDNPACCNPSHLRIGTLKENSNDRDSRNRTKKWIGAEHPRCKLTEDQVREVRRLRSSGVTGVKVAKQFGVSPQTISALMVGRFYGEVI